MMPCVTEPRIPRRPGVASGRTPPCHSARLALDLDAAGPGIEQVGEVAHIARIAEGLLPEDSDDLTTGIPRRNALYSGQRRCAPLCAERQAEGLIIGVAQLRLRGAERAQIHPHGKKPSSRARCPRSAGGAPGAVRHAGGDLRDPG